MDLEIEPPPENCGVEFDEEKCFTDNLPPLSAFEEEEAALAAECEEDDEECLFQAKAASPAEEQEQGRKSRGRSINVGIRKTLSEVKRLSLATKSGVLFPGVAPDPPYEGLPEDYYKKNYKPDYPAELKMRVECFAKSGSRKATGITRTHPKVLFKPSLSSNAESRKTLDPRIAAILEEPSPLEMNRMPPPIVSSSDELIVDWLTEHNIQMLLEYFLGLCVIHRPDDPWQFISQLCSRMIEARTSIEAFDSLPRLLTPEHSEAIFRIYDRIENGYISVAQYKFAMEAMGLSRFSLEPDGAEINQITKETFVKEATEAINDTLRSFMLAEEEPDDGKSKKDSTSQKNSVDVEVPRAAKSMIKIGDDEEFSDTESYTSSAEYSDEEEGEGEKPLDMDFRPLTQLNLEASPTTATVTATATEEEETSGVEEGEAEEHLN